MHVLAIKMLREFWQKHPEAEGALRSWYSVVSHAEFKDLSQVKELFSNSTDYVPPYTVFDVGGNNYRVVVIMRYRFKKVFVRHVLTHREYDSWNKLYRKGKV